MSPQITKRKLFGIDRSGPAPTQTRSDQPLNPWTLPNAIGFARLAGIPVFLAVALSSDDGHYLRRGGRRVGHRVQQPLLAPLRLGMHVRDLDLFEHTYRRAGRQRGTGIVGMHVDLERTLIAHD